MNVTISLPEELIRAARHQAVDRGVSLSKYVSEVLEEKVGQERERGEAHERLRRLMATGIDLGISQRDWTRDDLHKR